MVGRGELTDAAWAVIEPLLPQRGRRGKPWADHERVINGILWKLRTGAPWHDLQERYGPWQTCDDRFVQWRRDGTWDRLLARAQTKSDAVGEVVWEVSVASTAVRAHQHAAGPSGLAGSRASTGRSPGDATLSSAASTDLSSGAGSPPASKSRRPTTGRWSSSPRP